MKYVYSFKEGNKGMKYLLGGKGANLCEMTNLSLPVPQGFIVSTEACLKYYEDNMTLNDEVLSQIKDNIKKLEIETGKEFGSINNPLLLSIRSGARVSMPGMMDTILNLGLNDEIVNNYDSDNKRFILDSYRRLITMYSDVVKGLDISNFETILESYKKDKSIITDNDLNTEDLMKLIFMYKARYRSLTGEMFPQDPFSMLEEAVKAVFRSWNNERAIYYRKVNNIPDDWGTAVNVQEMVYGNFNDNSLTGVLFTRNPGTGDNTLFGEYLRNAQGEDIVAGIRTPENIENLKIENVDIYNQLYTISKRLENHFGDMQDIEFTVQDNRLYILQTRDGKRTGRAAIKIVVEMIKEGLITKEQGISRITNNDIDSVLHPTFDEKELSNKTVVATGIAASPGAGFGKMFLNSEKLKEAYDNGEENIILVREETSAEDVEAMNKSKAVVTLTGGMTSHAAVVARGMGVPCVLGCQNLKINKNELIYDGGIIKEGDYISVDGTNGKVYLGEIPTIDAEPSIEFQEFMKYIDETSKIKVRANCETEEDAIKALSLGASGIGLARTEHMFFDKERIIEFRKMIFAKNDNDRREALSKLINYQKEDFAKLFKVMSGYPITIRLLDPPLHEFMPKNEEEIKSLGEHLDLTEEEIKMQIESLKEVNPMMGHRGVRLAINYPEIAKMQSAAIFESYREALANGFNPVLEIMVPLVGTTKELTYMKEIIEEEYKKVFGDLPKNYKLGTMIEVPRASIIADHLAEHADFFSFGTNDLTQMTYAFSRDDAGKFLDSYYEKGIIGFNPFEKLDIDGVGHFIDLAVKKARIKKQDIELGICGEQGADEDSIEFLSTLGIDYISCSPYRIPNAKLNAAKANLKNNMF